jgi:hypothetical protein
VREFVSLATTQPYTVLVDDGDRSVNATSFMEMFTLNFSRPLRLNIAEEHQERFRMAAEKFLATN